MFWRKDLKYVRMTSTYYTAKNDLELLILCLYLLRAGTIGVHHHGQFLQYWGWNLGNFVHARQIHYQLSHVTSLNI